MAKLKKEAMGQYNYVLAETDISPKTKDKIRKLAGKLKKDISNDASVDLVEYDPVQLLLYKAPKAPQMFESKYSTDFRPPPDQNIVYHQKPYPEDPYTVYKQKPLSANEKIRLKSKQQQRIVKRPSSESNKEKFATTSGRAGTAPSQANRQRNKTAGKNIVDISDAFESRGMTPFVRAMIKARDNWKHVPEKSFDPLNPEKPKQERETFPYGSYMEKEQENIVQKAEDKIPPTPASARSIKTGSVTGKISRSVSRASSMESASSICTICEREAASRQIPLNSIMEEEEIELPQEEIKQREESIEVQSVKENVVVKKRPTPRKFQKPPVVNVFKTRSPDRRFYRSKIRQTPNEMNHYKKMRNRTFFKPIEQAIHEKDYVDHQSKYEPERQLLRDARWRVRQDLKDLRNENNMRLVDRFEKRIQLRREEAEQRRGYSTYADRNPVSIYAVRDVHGQNPPQNALNVEYVTRPRVTPSLGSVQRARNFSTHANVFNQAIAPPNWGPQKVDHNLFLPQIGQPI